MLIQYTSCYVFLSTFTQVHYLSEKKKNKVIFYIDNHPNLVAYFTAQVIYIKVK